MRMLAGGFYLSGSAQAPHKNLGIIIGRKEIAARVDEAQSVTKKPKEGTG